MTQTHPRENDAMDSIMTLTEAADYLKVSEKTILRMVRSGKIPGAKVSSQWRFLRSAIDDWMMAQMRQSSSHDLVGVVSKKNPLIPLPKLISPDRILTDLTPGSKQHILNQLVAPLIKSGIATQPVQYLADLLEREQVVSTGIGEGIALPHAHTPETTGLREECIVMGICREGTDFHSLDGKSTHLFFLIGSTSTENHLPLMAKTMLLLRVPGLQEALLRADSPEAVRRILGQAHEDLSIRL
jgi:PTS system nitrogen regulatory IIA component